MKEQLQPIMSAIFMVWVSLMGYGQNNLNDQFDDNDGYVYKITSLTPPEVKIVNYTGSATEVDIPETVDYNNETYTVTAIGENTDAIDSGIPIRPFFEKGLTRVSIPNTVTIIGLGAFNRNNLTEVDIPNSVTHIRRWAFAGNFLRELNLPASVEHIGYQAFYGLDTFYGPDNILYRLELVRSERNPPPRIDPTAFDTPSGPLFRRMDLVVPFGKVQDYKDAGWTKDLGFVTITSGITTVDNVKYGIVGSTLEATLIAGVSSPFNLIIPPTVDIDGYSLPIPVTAIGDSAFRNSNVGTIIIPESVKSIGQEAFYDIFDKNLDQLTMMSDDPPELDPDAFEYPHRNEIDLIVPENMEQVYKDAGWTGFREVFSLKGRQHLGDEWLWEVTSLIPNEVSLVDYRLYGGVQVEIPSEIEYLANSELDKTYTVTSIGSEAFKGKRLNSVLIPNTVDSIAVSAFHDNKLTSIDIPDAVTYIGKSAFESNQLTSVDIPENVTHIGEAAFRYNQLTSVTTPANVNRISGRTYASNELKEVTISDSVEYIDLYAFLDNPDLHLVTVEAKDPPSLHKDAFSNAYRDQIDLVVPADSLGRRQDYLDNGWHGFRSISFGIFTVDDITYGITSPTDVMVVDYTGTATAVEIPETVDGNGETYVVTAIKENAFQNKELASVGIPNSVTSIGELAFNDNQLTEVTLPNSMERIGGRAFSNNPDLALVTVEANDPPVLDATAFANAGRHEMYLVVPEGRTQVYEDNGWGGFISISEDSTPPRPTIDAPQSIDDLEPFTVDITFDVEVTDFGVDDIHVTNAAVSALTGSGSTYTVTIVPASPCGIAIDVPANVARGVNGLPNPAAQQVSVGVVDTIAPTITCPANVVANTADNGTDDCTTTVGLGAPVADDNCSVAAVVAQINGTDIDPDTYAFGAGTTIVTWIVSDATGNTASCEQTVTVEVAEDCRTELLVDFNRGFSPNGDGIGDTLVIEGLEAYRNNVVKIYDLSQRLLFRGHYGGPGDAWDGTDKDGMVPVGSYVCVIDYNEPGLGHEAKMIYVNY